VKKRGEGFADRLASLEELDLSDNNIGRCGVVSFSSVLNRLCLPALERLDMMGCPVSMSGAFSLMSALENEEIGPPLESVCMRLCLESQTSGEQGGEKSDETLARSLGGGHLPFVRVLSLDLEGVDVAVGFLEALSGPGRSHLIRLHLKLIDSFDSLGVLSGLAAGIRSGQLECLHSIRFCEVLIPSVEGNLGDGGDGVSALEILEERNAFFEALKDKKLPRLTELNLGWLGTDDGSVACLGHAVWRGNLGGLREVGLSHSCFGRVGLGALFGEGEDGLKQRGFDKLESLDLSHTACMAGGGASVFAAAVRSSFFPALSSLRLGFCGLTDEGLREMGEAVEESSGLSSLKLFDISGNSEISVGGFGVFVSSLSPRSLPLLRDLGLSLQRGTKDEMEGVLQEGKGQGKLLEVTLFFCP